MRASSLGLLLLLAGCAATTSAAYLYAPAVHANARVGSYPAAYYSIPLDSPTGDVRVVSFGLTTVQPQRGGPVTNVAQVRLIITNNVDDIPWTVDTRDAILAIAGEGDSRAAFVNTDAGAPPIVQVGRGKQRTLDLYYPLPPTRATDDALPAFDVTWHVRTATADVVQRTPFERVRVDLEDEYLAGYGYPYSYAPYALGIGYPLGYGAHWWYDAHYPAFGFHHRPAYVVGPGHISHHPLHVAPTHGYYRGHAGAGHHSGGHYSGGHHGGGFHGGGH